MVLLTATCGRLTTAADTTHTVCGVVKVSVVYLMLSGKLSVPRNQMKYLSDQQKLTLVSNQFGLICTRSMSEKHEQQQK